MSAEFFRIARWAALAVLIIVEPSGLTAKPTPKRTVNPDVAFMAKARAATIDLLRDPSSAQFRNLRIITDVLGTRKVCGEVNSKNGYGGYSGFTPFVYFAGTANVSSTETDNAYFAVSRGC